MIISKFKLLLFLTSVFIGRVLSQDTTSVKRPLKFGLAYNINTGLYYGHSLGCLMTNNPKHQFELNGTLLPGVNPFKEKMNFGSSLIYYFLPNKTSNRFNLQFTSSLLYNNYKTTEEYLLWTGGRHYKNESTSNHISLFIGFGFNVKITQRIYISTSLSNFLIGYGSFKNKHTDYVNNVESSNSSKSFDYLDFEDFMVYDLLAKVGLNVFLKK